LKATQISHRKQEEKGKERNGERKSQLKVADS
jgi:hypothetical protein